MEKRNVTVTLEKAKEWYNSNNESLKEIALQAFSRDEIMLDFENVAEVIKGGKESKSLKYAELVENLVSQLKGKDIHAAVEIISTIGVLLDVKELAAMMKCFEEILLEKVRIELLKSAKKGEIIIPDAMSFALMLKALMEKD